MFPFRKCGNATFRLMVFAIVLTSEAAKGEDVFIKGAGEGRGYSRAKGNVCYVITAAHVVKDSAEISVMGGDHQEAAGILRQLLPPDLAAVEVPKSTLKCTASQSPQITEAKFSSTSNGILQMREEDGSLSRMQVIVRNVGASYLVVEPQSTKDQIHKGMSGASLMFGDMQAGILVAVENQRGKVIRINWANQALDAFFSPDIGDSDIAGHALGDLTGDYEFDRELSVAVNQDKATSTRYVLTLLDSPSSDKGPSLRFAKEGDILAKVTMSPGAATQLKTEHPYLTKGWWYKELEAEIMYYASPVSPGCGMQSVQKLKGFAVYDPKNKTRILKIPSIKLGGVYRNGSGCRLMVVNVDGVKEELEVEAKWPSKP